MFPFFVLAVLGGAFIYTMDSLGKHGTSPGASVDGEGDGDNQPRQPVSREQPQPVTVNAPGGGREPITMNTTPGGGRESVSTNYIAQPSNFTESRGAGAAEPQPVRQQEQNRSSAQTLSPSPAYRTAMMNVPELARQRQQPTTREQVIMQRQRPRRPFNFNY